MGYNRRGEEDKRLEIFCNITYFSKTAIMKAGVHNTVPDKNSLVIIVSNIAYRNKQNKVTIIDHAYNAGNMIATLTSVKYDMTWGYVDDEGMFYFGRLVSKRRILVPCISNFQSRKSNNCWIWKYEFGGISKSRRNLKKPFPHDGFSTNLVQKTEFLNLGFCSIFFKFWHSVSFVKDYSVLVGRHTIFQYFLVKSDLCSLRPFRLHSSEKDAEYQNNR